MSCISAHDPQLVRLGRRDRATVGQQRFHVWFNNSTRLDLKQDGLEIAVPNDFISEWIGTHFTRPIQEAAHEVLGCPLPCGSTSCPHSSKCTPARDRCRTNGPRKQGSEKKGTGTAAALTARVPPRSEAAVTGGGQPRDRRPGATAPPAPAHGDRRGANTAPQPRSATTWTRSWSARATSSPTTPPPTSPSSPASQYNPLFIHGNCGLGKTHLLQGLCKRFIEHHPTKRWMYLTGEEFTNEFLTALRTNKLDVFRRKMRDLDLLVIDDVHFLAGKKATQEEFLHTFNAIEAMGRQVVMASDEHPKMIEEFGESLINRFVSGMVVRIDPPNYATRCEILRAPVASRRADRSARK